MEDSRRKGVSIVSCCSESDCDEGTDVTVTDCDLGESAFRAFQWSEGGTYLITLINCLCVSVLESLCQSYLFLGLPIYVVDGE